MPPRTPTDLSTLPVLTIIRRDALRDWLAENHEKADAQWLATFRKPHPDHVPWSTCVEELLCWGWIDGRARRIDDQRGAVLMTRRNPRSAWSAINKAHVMRARDENRMQPAGEAVIALAQANGMWAFLDDVEALVVPPDLRDALGGAVSQWDGWPRSVRRVALEWIKTARTPATRALRIADTVQSLADGLRPKPLRAQADRPSRASSTSKGTPG